MTLCLFDLVDRTGVVNFQHFDWKGLAAPILFDMRSYSEQKMFDVVDYIEQIDIGAHSTQFSDDFYERIHVSFLTLNVGTVVSTQIRQLTLWNAFRSLPKELQSQVLANAGGITLTGQDEPPLLFVPLQSRDYTVTITAEGPPNINAHILWTFDDGTVVDVNIVGRRAGAWTAKTNWNDFVTMRLEWLTDVLPAKYGTEQRRQLRIGPRKTYSFSFLLTNRDRRQMENAMIGWGVRPFVVPCWEQGQPLFSSLAAGNKIVPIKTYGRTIYPGSLIMLLQDSSKYEIGEVESFDDDSVTLVSGLQYAWKGNAKVYPAITMTVESQVQLQRATDVTTLGSVELKSTESIDLYNLPAWTPTMYLGYPVLTKRPSESSDPTASYERFFNLIESGTGPDFIDDLADLSRLTQNHRWLLEGDQAVGEFMLNMYYLRGKLKSMWIPTFRQDFLVVADVSANQSYLEVEYAGYVDLVQGRAGRKHLRIQTRTQVLYREIDSALKVDTDTERLFFINVFSNAFKAEDVILVSFMMQARMGVDQVEIGWHTDTIMESEVSFKLIPEMT